MCIRDRTKTDPRGITLDILLEVLEEGRLGHLVLNQALLKYQYLDCLLYTSSMVMPHSAQTAMAAMAFMTLCCPMTFKRTLWRSAPWTAVKEGKPSSKQMLSLIHI